MYGLDQIRPKTFCKVSPGSSSLFPRRNRQAHDVIPQGAAEFEVLKTFRCKDFEEVFAHLKYVDDDVDGGVGDEHHVVPPGQPLRPRGPLQDVAVLDHLVIYVELLAIYLFLSVTAIW